MEVPIATAPTARMCSHPVAFPPPPQSVFQAELGAGLEELPSEFPAPMPGFLCPCLPTAPARAPVFLLLQAAVLHPNTPVAQEQFIRSVLIMPPTSQLLQAALIQRRGFGRKT